MKDKILYLVLGILIGSVITAACFLVIGKSNKTENQNNGERPNFEEMQENGNMMKGGPGGQNGNRPQKPDDENFVPDDLQEGAPEDAPDFENEENTTKNNNMKNNKTKTEKVTTNTSEESNS